MPGGRPDPNRITLNAQTVFAGAGETALLNSYLSTTTQAARFGAADTFNYSTALFTGLFYTKVKKPTEMQRQGGEAQEAVLYVASPFPIQSRDQIVWRQSAYRVAGSPWPENLGGRVQWHTPIELANPV